MAPAGSRGELRLQADRFQLAAMALAICLCGITTSTAAAADPPAGAGDRREVVVEGQPVNLVLDVERLSLSCRKSRTDRSLLRTCELEAGLRLSADQRVSGRLYSECEGRIEVRTAGDSDWQPLLQTGNASTSLSNGRGSALLEISFRAPPDRLWREARAAGFRCSLVRTTLY
jgi:hypothetical protein